MAMCVNDIACAEASLCFSWTILPAEKIIRRRLRPIVGGVAEGCVQSGAALIGGETAEHPGLMAEDEYDLAGFAGGRLRPQ